MKVTKAMIVRAENKHFNTETYESLQRQHALQAVYYKQKGDAKRYKIYKGVSTKAMRDKIEKASQRKPTKKRKSSSIFGTGVSIRMPKF